MSEAQPPAAPEISPEFFIRVNDFIEMANRIERRFDTHHAQVAMLYAFTRYSAHHYLSSAKNADQADRDAFASYVGAVVSEMVTRDLQAMAAPATPATPASNADDAPSE